MSGGDVRVEDSATADYIGPDKDVDWVRFTGEEGSADPWPAIRSWADELIRRNFSDEGYPSDPLFWEAFPVHPDSAIVGIAKAFSEEALRAEVEGLADALRQGGCRGVIDAVREAPDPVGPQEQPVLHSTAVVGSLNLATRSGPDRITRADISEPDLVAVTDHALAWCGAAGGAWTLTVSGFSMALDEHRLRPTVHQLLRTDLGGVLQLTCARLPDQARTVTWPTEGRIIYSLFSARPLAPRDALRFGVDQLSAIAPHVTYGFAIHNAGAMPHNAYAVLRTHGWPTPRVQPHQAANRRLEVAAGWDAFAVILHGPDFPAMPEGAPYALVARIDGRTIWAHHDGERWIDGQRPRDLAEFERVRRALDPCLVPLNLV